MNILDQTNNSLVVYRNGEIEIAIQLKDETVWITQKQLADLFEVEVHTVNYHIKNIFKQKELEKLSTIRKIRIVQKEGKREVARDVEHYNLDMIISVGYRVNSTRATKFRQWATEVLKQYIVNGYTINSEKITVDRFINLENDMDYIKQKVNRIDSLVKHNEIEILQGVFFDGQIYDAYAFVNDLLRSAKKEVVLVDNYIDDTVLTLFSKYADLKFSIITKNISKQLKLDCDKYNMQCNNMSIEVSNKFHDRFLILDQTEAYHIGASLKDLGKKIFGFNKINIGLLGKFLNEDKK